MSEPERECTVAQQTEQGKEHSRKNCQDDITHTHREQMISICDTDMCERQTLPICV